MSDLPPEQPEQTPEPNYSRWKCPRACPYQSDDGPITTIGRITLPILTCALIGTAWGSVIFKEDRALNWQETLTGLGALFLSYQPTLFSEIATNAGRSAVRRYIGE